MSWFSSHVRRMRQAAPNYVLQRTPGTFLVSSKLRGPAPLNAALERMSDVPVIGKESTGCPAALDSIEAYLDLEDCDRDRDSFHFRCSATMPDRTYWIWEYLDGGDNKTQFVLTQMADGSVVYGCGSADDDAFDDEQLALFLFKHNV